MRACRSSRWHNRLEISAPTGACFFVFEDSDLTELTCVATHWKDVLQLHVSVLSLGLEPVCFPVDLADTNLDLHLLQAGFVAEDIAARLDPPAMAPDAIQQHETPATVCWIVTKKIKTSFIHACCITSRLVKIRAGIKPYWPDRWLLAAPFPPDNSSQNRSKRQVPAGLNRSNIAANSRPNRSCKWLTKCR